MSKAFDNRANLNVVGTPAVAGSVLEKTSSTQIGWAAGGGGGGAGVLSQDWACVVQDFGAVGDGVADDTNAFKAALLDASTYGYVIYIPQGVYNLTDTLRLDAPAKPFAMVGARKNGVILRRAGAYALSVLDFRIGAGIWLQGFTVDGGRDTYGAANQGVAFNQCNGCTAFDLRVVNYTATGVTFSTDGNPANVYERNAILACEADGGGLAINGFNLAQTAYGRLERCTVKNLVQTGPGYMFNIGAGSLHCVAESLSGDGGAVGVSLGGSVGFAGPKHTLIRGVTIRDVYRALQVLAASYSSIGGLTADMNNRAGGVFARFDDGAVHNALDTLICRNLVVDGKLMTFEDGASDNTLRVSHFRDEYTTVAPWITMDNTCSNNTAIIDSVSPAPTVTHALVGGAGAQDNLVRFANRAGTLDQTIAAGVISVLPGVDVCTVDTEAAAAADDLDTISSTGISDGHLLTLRTANSARVVTVRNGTGNIRIGAHFALSNVADTLTLRWSATASAWVEVGFGDNA